MHSRRAAHGSPRVAGRPVHQHGLPCAPRELFRLPRPGQAQGRAAARPSARGNAGWRLRRGDLAGRQRKKSPVPTGRRTRRGQANAAQGQTAAGRFDRGHPEMDRFRCRLAKRIIRWAGGHPPHSLVVSANQATCPSNCSRHHLAQKRYRLFCISQTGGGKHRAVANGGQDHINTSIEPRPAWHPAQCNRGAHLPAGQLRPRRTLDWSIVC